jgi:kinesin family protein C1
MSSRLSLGGPLRDSSSRQNSKRSSSASRRMSFGGGEAPKARSETPIKDRRGLLDEWRRQSRATGEDGEAESLHKRSRVVPEAPRLPPASSSTAAFSTEGTTALERFQMRKKLQQQQQQQQHLQGDESFQSNNTSMAASSVLFLEEYDDTSTLASARTAGTPSMQRRLGGARRSSLSIPRGRQPLLLSQEADLSQGPSLSQLTDDSDMLIHDPNECPLDTVEGAGLRSRVREMQQRVEKLEKEKMILSMDKAPLEARFRQKEDAWSKDQYRLVQEIEALKIAAREEDERHRDLQLQYDAIEVECKQLRHEIMKASSSIYSSKSTDNSAWSRQLQNDRDVADLKAKLHHAEEENSAMRLQKVSVEKELHATKIELDSLLRNFDELQAEYEEIARSTSDNREAEIKLEVLTTEHIAASAQLNAVCSDLAATKARAEASLEAKENAHKKELDELQFEMSVLKTRAGRLDDENESVLVTEEEDDAVLKARIEERDRRIAELEVQLLKGETSRRQMHNRIQELRGNIRVFVRTRPFLPSDGQSRECAVDVCPDGESLSILDQRNAADHDFKFDKVFPPSTGQDLVFEEVSDFVQSALDGYHVCLFSYGQTGSGKTHTMQGSGNGAMRGIIPRAVEQVLRQAKTLQNQKWTFNLSASFLEIYNEELKDLLVSMTKNGSKDAPKLSIKRPRDGKSYVDGLAEINIETEDSDAGMQQLEALMAVAARSRSVASTKMNAQSSRSHSIFMLNLRGFNTETGAEVSGALNLCDLAGSERLDRSGANSDMKRLRETQAINKSLSSLGDVFNALAQGATHIPYRNSKLTYLLQDCLSGDGKALMFVNLSPTTASSNESLCSLRFAQRVNQVELGKATKHIQYTSKR